MKTRLFSRSNNPAVTSTQYKALECSGAGIQVPLCECRNQLTDEGARSLGRNHRTRAPAVIPSASFSSGDRKPNGGASRESHGNRGVRDRGDATSKEGVDGMSAKSGRDEASKPRSWYVQIVLGHSGLVDLRPPGRAGDSRRRPLTVLTAQRHDYGDQSKQLGSYLPSRPELGFKQPASVADLPNLLTHKTTTFCNLWLSVSHCFVGNICSLPVSPHPSSIVFSLVYLVAPHWAVSGRLSVAG